MNRNSFAFATTLVFAGLSLAFNATHTLAASKNPPSGSGNWSSGTAISPVLQPDPRGGPQLCDTAVNSSGLTVAAWDQYTYNNGGGATIGVAVRSNGRWSAPFTISGASGFAMNPRVAVGADGTMAVSWTYEDPSTQANPRRKVQVAVRPAGQVAWTTATLADGTPGGVAVPHFVPLVIDAKGNVTAAWTHWDGTHSLMQTATLAAGANAATGWSAVATLGPSATESAMYPDLALNASGDAAIAYSVSRCAGCNMPEVAMYAFRRGAAGAWSAATVASERMYYVSNPRVALDSTDRATIVYFGYGVEANRQNADGTWPSAGRTILLTDVPGSSYGSIDLGLDEQGNALVAASIFDPTVNVDRSSVWVTRGTADGNWNTQQRLTDPTVPVDAYASRVAVSPDGKLAMVGWIDHYHGTVQVAQLAGGTQSTTTTWTTTTIGKGTAFSSYLEVLNLEAGSGTIARAVWKNAKTGTQWYAASYGP
ncbi:MAG: hypothetical protein FIB04_07530 [Gammaproteobacteria bacterium]|nr:hypothetical protein [Gammaproteobacteria bacterium]